ncbi:MAG: ATP-binding protein [Bacteroidia bacterium]|nr:ATP-binding protein [Bacteroidia bacterium]
MLTLFNKQEITSKDLDNLIRDKVEESLHLDYKASGSLQNTDAKKKEIAKDVSAFANSDGGIIIYGITEENHVPISYSFIDGHQITKEWLENVIHSNISKRIEKLSIIPIRYEGDISKTIYVIKIPSNSSAPHMANDSRYYRRYNFQSVPLEEYEVRNLYFKREKTVLQLADPVISIQVGSTSGGKISDLTLKMNFHIENVGNAIENQYKLEVALPRLVYIYGRTVNYDPLRASFVREENDYSIFSFPNPSPLFQNDKATICIDSLRIKYNSFSFAHDEPVKLKLYYSGGMEEREVSLADHMTYQGRPMLLSDFFDAR